MKDTAVIRPWDYFNYLWNSNKFLQWASDIPSQASSRTTEYWDHCRDLEFFKQLNLQPSDFQSCIPIYYHTDGVKVYKQQKAWVYSISSACRKGASMSTKLVFIIVRDSMIIKGRTHDAIGQLAGYITDTLMTGRFPLVDHEGNSFAPGTTAALRAGEPYCGGWTMAFAGFKGDWEAKAIIHKMTRYYRTTFICEHCLASYKKEFTFGDFRPTAKSQSVRFSHSQFLMMNPPNDQSMWRTVKGWTKERNLEETSCWLQQFFYLGICELCSPNLFFFGKPVGIYGTQPCESKDLLHLFHQGVLCVVIAALVCSHIDSCHPGITLKELDRVLSKEVYKHYRQWCRSKRGHVSACSHRFNAIRFGKEKWSQLAELGSIYKAAVVKTMLFWRNDYLKEQSAHVLGGAERAHCIHGFAKFQYILDISGPFLTSDQTREAVKYARAGLLFYQHLTGQDRARTDDRRFYKIIPKCHSLYELTLYMEQTKRNPRCFGFISVYFSICFLSTLLILHYLFFPGIGVPESAVSNEPRYEHCYQDEDLMKELSRIASRTHPATMDSVTMKRYRTLLELFC